MGSLGDPVVGETVIMLDILIVLALEQERALEGRSKVWCPTGVKMTWGADGSQCKNEFR